MKETEFGGKSGMVQSEDDGHVLSAAEELSLVNSQKE